MRAYSCTRSGNATDVSFRPKRSLSKVTFRPERSPSQLSFRPERSGGEEPAFPLRAQVVQEETRSFAALRMTIQRIGRVVGLALLGASVMSAWNVNAQSINVGQSPVTSTKGGHVQFVAEPQIVAGGKPATVLLHFKVDAGFHINSHTPKSEMLIPTKIAVEETPDLNVKGVDFPQGVPYSFSFEPKEKLDVYTGDFTLTAHLVTKPGQHSIKAALHYQACDAAACYPPKLLPLEQPFAAK